MANVKISDLPAASTPLTGAELVPIVQSGVTSQTTAVDVANTNDTILPALAANSGSSLVGFLQSGTGAVATTVQAKLRETVSVFDFMPPAQIAYIQAGNTASQDGAVVTAAIQAAIDYVTNGTVFFPAGAYKITSTLNVNYSSVTNQCCVNLLGTGLGSTLYWYGGNNVPFIWYKSITSGQGFTSKSTIEKLFLKNANSATGLTGIKIGNYGGALGMNGGVQNVCIQNNKLANFYIGIATEYESDGLVIDNNVFLEYTLYGVYNTGSAGTKITNNYFQYGTSGSIAIYCEYSTHTIFNNIIQSSATGVIGGIQLNNSSSFTITSNYLEFAYPGPAWAILLNNSKDGYIGSNSIQGMQGADAIYVDGTSYDINVATNSFGFFGYPMNSLIKTATGASGVNILGEQTYILSPVTISNASPGVVTSSSQGMVNGHQVYFTTTGTLPTGLTANTNYYVVNSTGYTFQVSLTSGGVAINTSSAGSGVHTCHVVIPTPLLGTGFNFVFKNGYALLGVGSYTGTPNSGITMASSGVLNIGNTAQSSGWAFQSFCRSGVSIGSITQSGTTQVAYNTSSDYRLKENVQPMQNALSKVAQLKPVTYTWKSDGSNGEGFIAHELAEVCPHAVTGGKDAVNEDGSPKYQGIDTSFLVATLVAAIQELTARIIELEKI